MGLHCDFELTTPSGQGGVAVFTLHGDVDGALLAMGLRAVSAGGVALRAIRDVDSCVVARWNDRCAHLMTHAGIEVVRQVSGALHRAGLAHREPGDVRALYPEASSRIEALALRMVGRTESPAAVDLLLVQESRWRAWDGREPSREAIEQASRRLRPLLDPPVVAAVGAANVGKSTLTNALAARSVSIVSDEPGATRDHVGVLIDLAGLVIRWIDTPGLRPEGGPEELSARAIAARVVRAADLVVCCGDKEHGFVAPEQVEAGRLLYVSTRTDLGIVAPPAEGALPTSAGRTGQGDTGIPALAGAVRERLLPADALAWAGPWAFDEAVWERR